VLFDPPVQRELSRSVVLNVESMVHGGPKKTNVNIFAAQHAFLNIYYVNFRPLIELKLNYFVLPGCFCT